MGAPRGGAHFLSDAPRRSGTRGSTARPLAGRVVARRFGARGDVVGAGLLQDRLGALGPLRIVGVHRKKDVALLDEAFIPLGFVLRNAEPDERAGDTTHG